jgi:hypothetical protein
MVSQTDSQPAYYQNLASVMDAVLFRYAPHVLKQQIFREGRWLLQSVLFPSPLGDKIDRFHLRAFELVENFESNSSTSNSQPTFKLIHLLLPHAPFDLDDQCTPYEEPPRKVSESDLYRKQAVCSLRMAFRLFDILKKEGVYDKTMIVLTADHGIGMPYDGDAPKGPMPEFQKAFPLLLVKPFGAKGALQISPHKTWITDLPATVMEGAQLKHSFQGHSVLATSFPEKRLRKFYYYSVDGHHIWFGNSLPDLEEFLVDGSARDPLSWTKLSDKKHID